MGELRAIEFIARLIDQGRLPRGIGRGKYRRIYMHRIALEDSAKALNSQSQLNTDYDFFKMLRDRGRRAAHRFLDAHFDDIGMRGTVDLAQEVQAEWHKVFTFCAGVRFTSDRCGGGHGMPPSLENLPTQPSVSEFN
jgi:hypothetical protein